MPAFDRDRGPKQGHAAELVKIKFCESKKVKDWLILANRVRIADAEFPS